MFFKKNAAKGTEPKKEISREELLTLLDAIPDFIGFAEDRVITYINAGGRKMLGLGSDKSVIGLPINEVHSASGMERFLKHGLEAMLRDGHWEDETELKRQDGTEVPVRLISFVGSKNPDGSLKLGGIIARDITEKKAKEQALKERMEEIEKMNKLLTDRELRMIELKNEVASLKDEVRKLRMEIEKLKES